MLGHANFDDMQLRAIRYVAKYNKGTVADLLIQTCCLAMLTARLCVIAMWALLNTISTQQQGRYCMFGSYPCLKIQHTSVFVVLFLIRTLRNFGAPAAA